MKVLAIFQAAFQGLFRVVSCNKINQLACDEQFNLLEFQAKVISAEHKNSAQHNCKVQQLLSQMKFFRRPAIYLEFSSYFICPPNSSVQHTIFTFCRLLPKSREREKKSASLSCDSSVASSQSTQLGEQQQLKDLLSIRACFHVCCCCCRSSVKRLSDQASLKNEKCFS